MLYITLKSEVTTLFLIQKGGSKVEMLSNKNSWSL